MTIDKRNQLPALLTELGLTTKGVELGVARGRFSRHLLAHCPLQKLYSIDRWAGDRGHGVAQCLEATQRLAPFGARSIVLRATFDEALDCFEDGSLDFAYIDGYAHQGNENGATLERWWPKIRDGGLLAGHDYSTTYPKNQRAVDAFRTKFAPKHRFKLTGKDKHPTWLIFG